MLTLVESFLDYLRFERARSSHTVFNYGHDLTAFVKFVMRNDDTATWRDVDSDLVRNWLEEMMDQGNTATSVNRRLSSLRSFYKYAMARGALERDPVYHLRGPKNAKTLPHYLREEEMDRLIDEKPWGDTFADCRDRMIILMLYTTGLRAAELLSLTDHSLDLDNRQLRVVGKRNKERLIPFGQELHDELLRYIAKRNDTFENSENSPQAMPGASTRALFLNDKGEPLTYQQLRRIVQRNLSLVTTMKKRSPHVLRHTFATAMLNNDSELESIKELLGHASVSTTEIYTHTTFEQLKKVYEQAHPRGEE